MRGRDRAVHHRVPGRLRVLSRCTPLARSRAFPAAVHRAADCASLALPRAWTRFVRLGWLSRSRARTDRVCAHARLQPARVAFGGVVRARGRLGFLWRCAWARRPVVLVRDDVGRARLARLVTAASRCACALLGARHALGRSAGECVGSRRAAAVGPGFWWLRAHGAAVGGVLRDAPHGVARAAHRDRRAGPAASGGCTVHVARARLRARAARSCDGSTRCELAERPSSARTNCDRSSTRRST